MYPETVEGLPEKRVLAQGGLPLEQRAAVGPGEEACGQGHRVADGESRVVGSEGEELLPEVFLELPEVSRLSGEGGAMDLSEGGEPLAIMTSEVVEDGLVGVYSEELAYDLYNGKDICIRELGSGVRGF